ncbi:glycolate oxidase iron-sulfur subunit [Bacillus oleivorans]|uniref:Glycolate oxidase iron-sulfur subunit n=1 Tax=Bacillus oleivorans TaxID=1448271 RepID=A0A285CQ05_9BACI|nr:(Fe-S)-binding protein [Bacillus oleivorans]SNX69627.1 glycolate oxidase iron-sulfur subunit [Bacillus oleivorans]
MNNTNLAYQETFDCVQCGYCLPACPTYKTMEKETHSPRGRINLVKMAAEGKISLSELEGPIDLCLGCRACETACPTNVQYGKILESAKEVLQEEKKKQMPNRVKMFQSFFFNKVLPNDSVLNAAGAGLAFYQQSGLQKVTRKLGILKMFPENLASFEKILPEVEGPIRRKKRASHYPAPEKPVYRIGFFTGCIMDTMFSSINTLSIKLLQAAGCDVTVIKEQTCCGALQSHSGEMNTTKVLAKKNIEAFEKHQFDYVVNSIGGCGAMLVEYDRLLADESEWADRARAFTRKNIDISVLLSELPLPFKKEIRKVVTYQPSCHMTNVQKRTKEPLSLLQSIPGIEYKELPEKDMCCGSAGIYNLVNYQESMEILDEKMKHVRKVLPEVIVTTNPGCHLQMKLGVEREQQSDKVQVVHLVELLAESCEISV